MSPLFLAALCLFVAFIFTLSLTALLIPVLRKKRLGQSILEIGPSWHKAKEGTPTMGGAVFATAISACSLLGVFFSDSELALPLLILILFAILNALCGVWDDLEKLKNKKNQGLLPWQKLLLQSISAAVLLFLWERHVDSVLPLQIPFLGFALPLGVVGYFILELLLVGTVNCANLSDGIDGLAATLSLVTAFFFCIEGIIQKSDALLILGASMVGALLAFLVFNRNPARIFMGDTGSLFLGALAVGGGFLLGEPLVLILYSLPYLFEGASVILQVVVYKKTRKRLFLMAPFHHHLEKRGWSEGRIVRVFGMLAILSALVAHYAI